MPHEVLHPGALSIYYIYKRREKKNMELQNANGIEKVQDNIEYNVLPEEIIIDHETDTVASKKLFVRKEINNSVHQL